MQTKYIMDLFDDDFLMNSPEDFEEHILDLFEQVFKDVKIEYLESCMKYHITADGKKVICYVDEYEDLRFEDNCLNQEYDRSR